MGGLDTLSNGVDTLSNGGEETYQGLWEHPCIDYKESNQPHTLDEPKGSADSLAASKFLCSQEDKGRLRGAGKRNMRFTLEVLQNIGFTGAGIFLPVARQKKM